MAAARATLLLLLLAPASARAQSPRLGDGEALVALSDGELLRLRGKAKEAQRFASEQGLSGELLLLMDASIHSGLPRLFVWSARAGGVVDKGLVAHGACANQWAAAASAGAPKFSNVPESHCSSLGKYRIGKRGPSGWGIGINYKLHGLEASNSAAYARYIVLHSWQEVGDAATYPEGTVESWGCPAVSDNFMRRIDARLRERQSPVLLWIFE